jgi:hypothetical protein
MWQTSSVRSSVLFGVLVALTWAALLTPDGRTAEPWPSVGLSDSPSDKAISKALAETTQLEFIETPLEDVVAFLADRHKIPIQLDKRAMDNVGVGSDTPVTRNLKQVSLRSALRLILGDLSLTYMVDHEVLLITSADIAERTPQLRIYQVAAFLRDGITSQQLAATLQVALEADASLTAAGAVAPPGPVGGLGLAVSPGAPSPASATPVAPVRPPLPRIIPFQTLLLVRHTSPGHDEMASLLRAMAEGLKKEGK